MQARLKYRLGRQGCLNQKIKVERIVATSVCVTKLQTPQPAHAAVIATAPENSETTAPIKAVVLKLYALLNNAVCTEVNDDMKTQKPIT